MVVGSSRQENLDPGFVVLGARRQGVPVILRELVLPDEINPVSTNFTIFKFFQSNKCPQLSRCIDISEETSWRLTAN
ncbi:unnamed protein product [Schistosoma margrebowiei]|uniref:Uncharacterized protein n=1 Tax=Schistosoma margrebowiei TaxID=48269 RepID=A0A183LEL9_9TREM|nr:unnamed protein product [Schistosoma margrebowiei]